MLHSQVMLYFESYIWLSLNELPNDIYVLCIFLNVYLVIVQIFSYYSKLLLISEFPYTWHDINRSIISTFDPNHNWPAQGPLITWVTKFWNKRAWNPITAALYISSQQASEWKQPIVNSGADWLTQTFHGWVYSLTVEICIIFYSLKSHFL